MATKDDLLKDLDSVTEKISSQVWTLNLGTLGTTWSLLIATSEPPIVQLTAADARPIVILCITSLLCEMAQYLSGYVMDLRLLNWMERTNASEFQFDRRGGFYLSRRFFFYCKIVLTGLHPVPRTPS
jgi:hypothetical protein